MDNSFQSTHRLVFGTGGVDHLLPRVRIVRPGIPQIVAWTVLALLVLSAAPEARQRDRRLPARTVAKIEQAVTSFMAKVRAPGLSMAIGSGGELRFEKGYGLADLENVVPARASTVYRLASVSKAITAVAVMQLVERRRLGLEDTVGRWLPDVPAALRRITVRQLLSHQSGIRHYTAAEDDHATPSPRHYASLREALTIFENDPLVHEPGTAMTYSTFGYTLLGVVIEAAAAQTYADFVRDNIFEPAGMGHSRPDDVLAIVRNRSAGYAKTAGGDLRKAGFVDPSYKTPGGGWLSTAGDMVRFGLALEAGRLLRTETFTQMTTMNRVPGKDADTFYALGWIVDGWGDPNLPRIPGLVWHGGVQQGVTTNLYMLPREQIVVAVMTNLEGEGLTLTQLAAEITNIVLDRRPE